ncbi:hypothetical protein LUZ60_007868 [Juncus effusus]|nr:hypothetical protein LUZ60_007868 [Juncus effusus]
MSMASKALQYWRSVSAASATGTRGFATTAHAHELQGYFRKLKFRGEYMPVYVVLGLIVFSVSFGLNTARLHLAYNPNVLVDKKKRETVPEVVAPDWSLEEAKRLFEKSIFRKVAYLQDFDRIRADIGDPTRAPARKALEMKAETLKDVGVDLPGFERKRKHLRDVLGNLISKKEGHSG